MNFCSLKDEIRKILPILDKNTGISYSEYINGNISKGCFNYINSRQYNAFTLLELPSYKDGTLPDLYSYAATLLIDLRDYSRESCCTMDELTIISNYELYLINSGAKNPLVWS